MKTIEECLDIILLQLHKDWNKPGEHRDFLKAEELLQQFGLSELYHKHEFFKRLINKLVKDDYAEHIYNGITEGTMDFYQKNTLITIEGYYFIENGGYKNKKFNEDIKKAGNYVNLFLVAVAAIAATWYSGQEIYRYISDKKEKPKTEVLQSPPLQTTKLKQPYADTTHTP